MKKLSELVQKVSLSELIEALASTISDTEVTPEPEAEGEEEFVKVHKTEKHPDPYGNKGSEAVKKDTSKAGKEPKKGFPPEVKEETIGPWYTDERGRMRRVPEELDESGAVVRGKVPLIKRPKFDERGNVVLTKDAKKNISYGKAPRSRKLTGRPYSNKKGFGEEKEQLDEKKVNPAGQTKKTPYVLVVPKGEKSGGKVKRIPKSKYNPKIHSLAEDQLDELSKNTLTNYIKVASARAIGNAYEGSRKKDSKLTAKAVSRVGHINRAADRLGGTYEVGKPMRVMIPGKNDNDPASGPYTIKKKKIYHAEEAEQLDEVSAPGEETWIKHRKGDFKQRYGDRWKEVLYATAWSRSKHNYPRG